MGIDCTNFTKFGLINNTEKQQILNSYGNLQNFKYLPNPFKILECDKFYWHFRFFQLS